ncbi:MAG: hypothetical protein KDJ44_02930 [Rhodoblastus sp.]|nr:hypothetical protein [Rhodoblastus sp.]MCC0004721.1 hypothetical protein [Methylobacteriaceae bacterium]
MQRNVSSPREERNSRALPLPLTTALTTIILAIAAFIQIRGGFNLDVSWFITFAERTFQGAIPYVEVSDPNPPASIMIYLPALFAAKWTGLKVEALVAIMTFAMAIASAKMASSFDPSRRSITYLAALFSLTVVPAAMFAEREHYAAIAALPAVAAIVAAGRGLAISRAVKLAAGAVGALTVAFKPHFAAALAIPAIYATVRRRSLRWISPWEVAAFVGVLGLYVAVSYYAYPAYFTIALPEAVRLYAGAHATIWMAIGSANIWFMIAVVTVSMALALRFTLSPAATGAALASLGFAIACFVQQRYQVNHTSPAVEIGTVALIEAAFVCGIRTLAIQAIVVGLAVMAPIYMRICSSLMQTMTEPGLVETIQRYLPADGGRLAAITESQELMWPAARLTGAKWVYRYNGLYRQGTADWLLEQKPDAATVEYLNEIITSDQDQVAEDIVRGRPDVVVIDDAAVRERAFANPAVAAAMSGYQMVATVPTSVRLVEIWKHSTKSR